MMPSTFAKIALPPFVVVLATFAACMADLLDPLALVAAGVVALVAAFFAGLLALAPPK